jgi:uncharacterized membrane protein YfcA
MGIPDLPPYSLGYVHLTWWALLVMTSVPFSFLGVRAAHALDRRRLQAIFALVLAGIGITMLLSG